MHDPNDLIELAEKIHKPNERYIMCKQICERLERGVKTIFAECFLEASAGSIEERKQVAYNHPKYKAYIAEWNRMEREKAKALIVLDNFRTLFDAKQSVLSHQREELKRGM